MGTINTRREESLNAPKKHLNWMGGPSYELSPLIRLRTAAASCFFGEPMYYHTDEKDKRPKRSSPKMVGCQLSPAQLDHLRDVLNAEDPREWRDMSPAQLMESAIDAALQHDPLGTLSFAAELRQKLHIRTTPQVIMVRAARHPKVKGTDFIAKYSSQILSRLDEPTVQMAYYLQTYGKPIPSVLKRAWARQLEKARPQELAKYRMEGRQVNLYDVVNICHPKSDAVSEFMKGKIKQNTEELETWEAVRSKAGKVEGAEAKKAWTEASKKMGHMALLRNLRNLEQNGALTDELLKQLVNGAPTGKQLPFRYYAAFKALDNAQNARACVQDAIEDAMQASLGNLPTFKGRAMSLVDNSGSTHGTPISKMSTMRVCDIGNMMGVLTAKVSDEGSVGVFGDRYAEVPIRKRTSIFDDLNRVNTVGEQIGGSTEHGIWLFWDKAIREKQHWDHVFVYSDMQAGHGGLYGSNRDYPSWFDDGFSRYINVPKLISEYRHKVNPNVMVYLVQIAGYQDTLIPEFYKRTYILGGWSEEVLRFAAYMTELQQ